MVFDMSFEHEIGKNMNWQGLNFKQRGFPVSTQAGNVGKLCPTCVYRTWRNKVIMDKVAPCSFTKPRRTKKHLYNMEHVVSY